MLRTTILAVASMCLLTACGDDDSKPVTDAAVDAPAGDGGDAAGDPCDHPTTVVHVKSNITTNTTWTCDKIYVVDAGFVISAVLTIEPRVIVKLTPGAAITFFTGGSIVADGKTASTPIVFTSAKDDSHGGDTNGDGTASTPAPGDWNSIKVSQTGSVFNHCQVMYGGGSKPYSGALSVINNGTASITNCIFANNDGGTLADTRAAALHVGGCAAGTVVTGNTFYNNGIPLVINGLINLDNTNVFHFQPAGGQKLTNTLNGIFMDGVSHAITGSVTWGNTNAPYVLDETVLSIADGGTLTLLDNVVVKSWKGRIDVANLGTLTQGSNDTFTSLLDDSLLGDTNGDGVSTPAKGDWTGINVCKPLCKYTSAGNILFAQNP